MNLQPLNPPPAPGYRVQCTSCATMTPADQLRADMDAPEPTYYCPPCVPRSEYDPFRPAFWWQTSPATWDLIRRIGRTGIPTSISETELRDVLTRLVERAFLEGHIQGIESATQTMLTHLKPFGESGRAAPSA